jgi:flagellar basal-body rod protein FlgF
MNTSTYISLSGQNARERQMEVLANNIANLSTAGFKGERMMFNEYLANAKGANESSYVSMAGNARDMSQGPLTHTGNPLDIALSGDGFLAVSQPDGATGYTRNGHLQLDAQGQIVTASGYVVQGDGGPAIVVPPTAGQITIGTDGTVSTKQGSIGKIPVVTFDKPQAMVAQSGSLYTTDQSATPVTTTQVMQGTIEESNVQPVLEMTRLMNSSHEIAGMKNFVDGEHQRLKSAIDRLGKSI